MICVSSYLMDSLINWVTLSCLAKVEPEKLAVIQALC